MNKHHKFTRRSFLKTSIASLTTVMIVPRHVLGGAGFTPPSETLTRAVIGTGGMGMGHVTSINTACKLLAVCDVDEKHLQTALKTVAAKPGGADVKGYRDFREVLARKDIDMVHVPTPPHWHALISIAAAKAGKDATEGGLTPIARNLQVASTDVAEERGRRKSEVQSPAELQRGPAARSSWRAACALGSPRCTPSIALS